MTKEQDHKKLRSHKIKMKNLAIMHKVHVVTCPFKLMRQYMALRGNYNDKVEQFFVFSDFSPVTPSNARQTLHTMIARLNLDSRLYGMHSFRIRRTTDLIKYNYPLEEIKLMGRWRSNVVYKYIR